LKLKKLFIMLFVFNTISLFLVALIISRYQDSTDTLENAYNMQYKSLILADELRQSSDDLTRMARTYVITGNSLFEEQYKTVLDIRNGEKQRPQRYNGIFWDFYTLNKKEVLDGKKIPLRELMIEANFPEEELSLLFISQNESDDLTKLEHKAMNAIKGIFQDKDGTFSIIGKPDFKLARDLIYSKQYHEAKMRIMKPIDDFYKAFEKRTKEKVLESHKRVKELEFYVNLAVLFSIIFIILSFFIILFRIIYSVDSLRQIMISLSKNDMSVELLETKNNDEISDMMGAVKIFKKNTQNLISSENKLRIAIDDARNANKAKSIFLARMSHELRTPLNAILGFASLISKSQRISKQEKENLLTIKKSGNHLLNIINEILELSKIEAGKMHIVPKTFNLHDLIIETESIFKFRCESKNLKFNTILDENLPILIKADDQRLRQILMNLLSNALKFTKEGEINLYAYAKMNKLFFEVRDSGIGIKKCDRKRLFEPFEQIIQNNYNQNGTGLGLSITKELIILMGGKIHVKSKINEGSTFFFNIDYKTSFKEDLEKADRVDNIIGAKKNEKKNSILVVDDIKENRDLVIQVLKYYGFNTYEAKNGLAAIFVYEKNKIDLIFMDILMDKLGGLETIKKLKNKYKNKMVPIIALSANVFSEDKEKAIDIGASAFLSKPVSEKDILLILEEYLSTELIIDNKEKELSINLEEEFNKLDSELLAFINNASNRMDGDLIKQTLKAKINNPIFLKEIEILIDQFDYMRISKYTQNKLL